MISVAASWFIIGLLAGVGFSAAAVAAHRCLRVRRTLIACEPTALPRVFIYRGEPDAQTRARIAAARSN